MVCILFYDRVITLHTLDYLSRQLRYVCVFGEFLAGFSRGIFSLPSLGLLLMAAVKVFILVVKAVTKPFAKRVKVSEDPTVTKASIWVGRFMNRMSHRVNVMGLGHKIKKVKELSEKQAKSDGAEFISEGIILSISCSLLGVEYWRRGKADDYKKMVARKQLAEEKAQAQAEIEDRFQLQEKRLLCLEERLDKILARIDESVKAERDAGIVARNNNTFYHRWYSWFSG